MTKKKPIPKTNEVTLSLVDERISEQKTKILDTLTKLPVIQVAVKRVGISRATFYRWRTEDFEFNNAVVAAIREGSTSINELAQSKLIEEVSHGNMTALIFWLKSRDPLFSDRRTIINEFKVPERPVSPEAAEAIDNVFTLFERVARREHDRVEKEVEEEDMALESSGGLDSESDNE